MGARAGPSKRMPGSVSGALTDSFLPADHRSMLKLELREQELAHEDVVRQLKLEHAKEITKLRQEFELQAK